MSHVNPKEINRYASIKDWISFWVHLWDHERNGQTGKSMKRANIAMFFLTSACPMVKA